MPAAENKLEHNAVDELRGLREVARTGAPAHVMPHQLLNQFDCIAALEMHLLAMLRKSFGVSNALLREELESGLYDREIDLLVSPGPGPGGVGSSHALESARKLFIGTCTRDELVNDFLDPDGRIPKDGLLYKRFVADSNVAIRVDHLVGYSDDGAYKIHASFGCTGRVSAGVPDSLSINQFLKELSPELKTKVLHSFAEAGFEPGDLRQVSVGLGTLSGAAFEDLIAKPGEARISESNLAALENLKKALEEKNESAYEADPLDPLCKPSRYFTEQRVKSLEADPLERGSMFSVPLLPLLRCVRGAAQAGSPELRVAGAPVRDFVSASVARKHLAQQVGRTARLKDEPLKEFLHRMSMSCASGNLDRKDLADIERREKLDPSWRLDLEERHFAPRGRGSRDASRSF